MAVRDPQAPAGAGAQAQVTLDGQVLSFTFWSVTVSLSSPGCPPSYAILLPQSPDTPYSAK